MKNIREWIIVGLTIAVLFFATTGFFGKNYDIVDKQDELREMFQTTQASVVALENSIVEAQNKLAVLETIETLSAEEQLAMDNLPNLIQNSQRQVIQGKIEMTKMQFSYGILEDLR